MASSFEQLAADPPAYTASVAAPPTSIKRSLEDTRQLIFSNASIIRPRQKNEGPIELVVGKTRPPAGDLPSTGTRSFTSSTSRVRISVTDQPQTTPNSSDSAESDGTRVGGRHYAALVNRSVDSTSIDMIILGEPQDTIEEALEWMLDRTQIVITDMMSRHRKQVSAGCCFACTSVLKGQRQ